MMTMVKRIMMMTRRIIIGMSRKDSIDYWDNEDYDGHGDDVDDGHLDIRAAKTALIIGSLAVRYSSPPLCHTNILIVNIT